MPRNPVSSLWLSHRFLIDPSTDACSPPASGIARPEPGIAGTQTLPRMKIRLQSGSIRFRLRQRDVQSLIQNGSATEFVHLGDTAFSCALEIGQGSAKLSLTPTGIRALVPGDDARRWANGGDVGLYFTLPEGTRLMVEKDWACMEPSPGDSNDDTFPRPGSV